MWKKVITAYFKIISHICLEVLSKVMKIFRQMVSFLAKNDIWGLPNNVQSQRSDHSTTTFSKLPKLGMKCKSDIFHTAKS
jgi:hypothetical protein